MATTGINNASLVANKEYSSSDVRPKFNKESAEVIESGFAKGSAMNIIYYDENDQKFKLNLSNVEQILCNESVKDLPVVLVSICGAFRKGKSFFMSILLKYIYEHFELKKDFEWSNDQTLKGFKFQSGSKRMTSGVMMWSEPFIVEKPNKQKIAIYLMDTQGLFDSKTSIRECSSIFALTTLVSSKIIYNLHQQIQEDDLNNLLFFAEYGKFMCTETGTKPFHDLTFLVRDWQWVSDFAYGPNPEYLDSVLNDSSITSEDLKQTRRLLSELFRNLDTVLIPYPGTAVATNVKQECKLSIMDKEFRTFSKLAREHIMAIDKLNVLTINDSEVTSSQLKTYMEKYMTLFSSNDLPEPRNLYIVTAEANNLSASNNAKNRYISRMDAICSFNEPFKHSKLLKKDHDAALAEVIALFKSTKKMGDAEFCKSFEEDMVKEIEKLFDKYSMQNDAKRSFTISSFCLKVVTITVFMTILANILKILKLKFLYSFISKLSYTLLLLMIVSSVMKYSNYHHEIIDLFEQYIDSVYEAGLAFILNATVSHATRVQSSRSNAQKKD